MKRLLTILFFLPLLKANAVTTYFWPTTNISIALTMTNYPSIHAGDTIYVNPCSVQAGYRSLVIKISPAVKWVFSTLDSNRVKIIFVNSPSFPTIKTNSSGNLFADSLSACDNLLIKGLKMADHTDPLFFYVMSTGYLHHLKFVNDTLQNQPGFWGSSSITTSLTNYAGNGDTTNCVYDLWFHNCVFDSIGTPSSGGLTVLYIGGMSANQVVVMLTVDSCSFNYIPSVINGATAIHCQQVYGEDIHDNAFTNLGVITTPVGHAATIFEQASFFYVYRNFFHANFANCVRAISQVSVPTLATLFTSYDPNYDGISRFYDNILDSGRKYPMIESQKDTIGISGVSWAQTRRSARVWNNTLYRGGVGIGDGPYMVSTYDWYYVTYTADTLELHNCVQIGLPTDTTSGVFCYSSYCNALITRPNNGTPVYDTANNKFSQTLVYSTSGLADTAGLPTIGFYPLTSGILYGNGGTTPSWLTKDFHGNSVPSAGSRYDIGAVQYTQAGCNCPNGVRVGFRWVLNQANHEKTMALASRLPLSWPWSE